MIPRIIHQIFNLFDDGKTLEDYPIMVECSTHNERWCDENPTYTYCYLRWDKVKCDALIRDHFPEYLQVWEDFTQPIQRVDFARYCILHTFGGIYVDMDIKIIRDLEPLLHNPHFFTTWNDDARKLPYNAVMGSEPDQQVFRDIIQHSKDSFYEKLQIDIYRTWVGRFVFQTTGHFMLQRVLKKHAIETMDLLKINTKNGNIVSGPNPFFEDWNISSWY